ncbi:MAG: ribokinase [Firmicutes bacterium]|nr:ribokinase [Bacillota bacterium]
MNRICVVGSLNMDMAISTPRIPLVGETILGSGFMTVPGGKGANQAVAAARLGGDVSMVGCVGDDPYGCELLGNLESAGVETDSVSIIHEGHTGVAVIVVGKDGDNFIIVDQGANLHLNTERLDRYRYVMEKSNLLMLQLEIPSGTVEYAVDIAARSGVPVFLDPAPAAPLGEELLSRIDILTPNESETAMLVGFPIDSIDDAGRAAALLHGRGVMQVAVTLGDKGVVYNCGDSIVHRPAFKVEAVDTTAAGDVFSGALAVSLAEGSNIDEAVEWAAASAALAVTRKGAQTSIPDVGEVRKFLSG